MSENNQREKTTFMSRTIHQNFFEKIIDQNLWRVIVNCGFRAIETFDYGDYLGFIYYFPLFFFFFWKNRSCSWRNCLLTHTERLYTKQFNRMFLEILGQIQYKRLSNDRRHLLNLTLRTVGLIKSCCLSLQDSYSISFLKVLQPRSRSNKWLRESYTVLTRLSASLE